jgi:cytoskeleton protein RodZ
MTEFAAAGDHPSATPGATLAAVRKAQGLSTSDVALQMRLSVRQIEAIEADRYNDLPGAVFVRGFIRNYARLLKIDSVPLLHALEAQVAEDAPLRTHAIAGKMPADTRRGHTRLWLGVLAIVALGVGLAGGYELWRSHSERTGSAGGVPSSPARKDSNTEKKADSVTLKIPLAPPPLTGDLSSSSPARTDPAPAQEEKLARPPEPVERPQTMASSERQKRVEIEFLRDSWIELRRKDGVVLYSGTGLANTTRNYEVDLAVELTVGNVSGVRITYNGKAVDLTAHATRNIARFTLE